MTLNLESGRSQQKRRTRDALIAAARDLIAKGASPTVEDAALAAGISRTTAYRYFENQAALLGAAHPETVRESFLPAHPPSDPVARVEIVVREILRVILATEGQQRTMLRLSLEAEPDRARLALRQGRAIKWIEEALEPLRARMSKAAHRRLVLAIRSATGIEALVWLVDVAGLSRDEAVRTMRWSAGALVRAAIAEL